MASIERRSGKDGTTYKITVSGGRDISGRQKRHYMTWKPEPGLTARQVEKRVKQIAVEFEKEIEYGFQPDNRQTFGEYAPTVIQLKKDMGGAIGSADRCTHWLHMVSPYIGNMKLRDIRPQHIRELMRELSKPGQRKKCGQATPIIDFKTLVAKEWGTQAAFQKAVEVSRTTMLQVYQGKHIGYQSAVKIAEALSLPVRDLFAVDMQDDETISRNTLVCIFGFLSAVFKQAERDMLITINPVERVQPPRKAAAARNFFQPEQVAAILEAAESEPIKWKTMIHLFIVSGARRGEVLALKWENVDWEREQIKIDSCLKYSPQTGLVEGPTKTQNTRYIPLPAEMFQLLRQYRRWQLERRLLYGDQWKNSPYVFTGELGGPIYTTSLNAWFDKFTERHNLPFHVNPHAFRHTAASIMISHGVDVVSVAGMLGHATARTTMEVYSHAIEETKREAAECIADTILRKKA